MKVKLKTKQEKERFHVGRLYFVEPKHLRAYNTLVKGILLMPRYKEALETLGVEFEVIE